MHLDWLEENEVIVKFSRDHPRGNMEQTYHSSYRVGQRSVMLFGGLTII